LCQLLRLLDDRPYPVCSRAFKRLPPRSPPASIQLPSSVLLAAIASVGMLESGSGDTGLLLQHSTTLTGSVDVGLQASRLERPLSGLSDSCRRAGGYRPPVNATRRGRASRRALEPESACRRRAVAGGRHRHAWSATRSDFCSTKLRRIELMTFQKTIKFGAVPPGETRCLTDVSVGDF
jgi:hypothetical protein